MRLLLLAFSLLSRGGSRVKNLLYDHGIWKPRKPPLPVISVGNITFGGSGKTPLAVEILTWLVGRGRRPALISRGYRGKWEKTGGVLSDGERILAGWRDGGDEPFLAAKSVPNAGVFIGRDRLSSCRRAAEMGFDLAVLDDGFQHRRLARDLDIVLFSPEEKIALREPVSSLRRADVVLMEKASLARERASKVLRRLRREPFAYSVVSRAFFDLSTGKPMPTTELARMKVLAFCGIARPLRFRDQLLAAAVEPVSFLSFPDHHEYPARSLSRVARAGRACGAQAAVTTEKDAVKLAGRADPLGPLPVYVLRIGLEVEPRFYETLNSLLCR
jgi:tetraacyldisaccharide 4'-kinase